MTAKTETAAPPPPQKRRLAPMVRLPEGTEDESAKRARPGQEATPPPATAAAGTGTTLPSPFTVDDNKSTSVTGTPAPPTSPNPFNASTPASPPASTATAATTATATTAGGTVTVDTKADLEEVLASLDKASELSETSKELLRSMASPCVETPAAERHPMQRGVGEMLRTAVEGVCARLQKEADMALKLAETAADKKDLQCLMIDQKIEALRSKVVREKVQAQGLAVQAAVSLDRCRKLLDSAREEQEKKDGRFIRSALIKDNIEKTLADHFLPFLEGKAEDGPAHLQAIRSLVAAVGIEESLLAAFERAASLPAQERSPFDNTILNQVHEELKQQHAEHAQIAQTPPKGFERRKAAAKAKMTLWQLSKETVRNTSHKARLSECAAWECEGSLDQAQLDLRAAKEAASEALEGNRKAAAELRSFKQGPVAALQRLELSS